MPNEITLAKRAKLAEVATEIDTIAGGVQLYDARDGGLAKQLAVAQAIVDMRALLTDEVMVPIMALANTGLGFKTDQDPNRPSRSNPNPKPYSVAVVREVVIEAKLRGFNVVGQEFNIIAGGFYAAKNGLQRKLRDGKIKGLAKFRDFYEMPKLSPDGQSGTVKCHATWECNGKPERADFEFYIKLHGMGPDAALGKAERRLAKEVLKFVTGEQTPDGEVDDDPVANAKSANPESDPAPGPRVGRRVRRDAVPADSDPATVDDPTPVDDQIPGAEIPPVGTTEVPPAPAPDPAPAPAAPPPPPAAKPAAPAAHAAPAGASRITFEQAIRAEAIAPVDAMTVIRRMFPEATKDARTVAEVEAQLPNVVNAVRKSWPGFKTLCAGAKTAREAESGGAPAGEATQGSLV